MKTLFIIAGILLVVYVTYKTYSISNIDKGLDKLITNKAIILDVRTETEFNTGHIDGAVNIPLSHLRKDSIPFSNDKEIITCCSHGLRSIKAVDILRSRGFKNAHNGGAWSDLEELCKAKK
jgi:phage shock protein E